MQRNEYLKSIELSLGTKRFLDNFCQKKLLHRKPVNFVLSSSMMVVVILMLILILMQMIMLMILMVVMVMMKLMMTYLTPGGGLTRGKERGYFLPMTHLLSAAPTSWQFCMLLFKKQNKC